MTGAPCRAGLGAGALLTLLLLGALGTGQPATAAPEASLTITELDGVLDEGRSVTVAVDLRNDSESVDHGDGPLEEVATAFVRGPEGGEPLRFSILLELSGPVATRADEAYEATAIATSARRALRVAEALEALEAPIPATVSVDGRTVDELRAVAGGAPLRPDRPDVADRASSALEKLEAVAARDEIELVAQPYGPADIEALTRAGMADEAQALTDRGRAAVEKLGGGNGPSSLVVPPRGLDGTTAGWLSGTASPTALAYSVEDRDAELAGSYLRGVAQARGHLDNLRGVLGEQAIKTLREELDVASSVDFRGEDEQGDGMALASEVSRQLDDVRAAVAVAPGPRLTLTGAEGTVPVTLSNSADRELRVRVRVLTTRFEVDDEAGREIALPPRGEVSTTFDVRSQAPGGTYPVLVEVTDPQGEVRLGEGQVLVRSAAFSVAGAVVTAGAALFLIGWGLHGHSHRRRAAPAATPAVAPSKTTAGTPE